jgi:hypothetical protein
MRHRIAPLVFGLCWAAASAAQAQPADPSILLIGRLDPPRLNPICGVEEAPLLQVRAMFSNSLDGVKSLILYKSGRVLLLDQFSDTIAAVDTLAPADWSRVLGEIANARVGFARDCSVTAAPFNNVLITTQLTWYGEGSRRNRFTVTTADPQTCSNAMQKLIYDLVILLPVGGID